MSEIHILQTQDLPESCEAWLAARYTLHRSDGLVLSADLRNSIRAIVGANVPARLIAALPNLEIIACFGVGYDSVDIDAARGRGIRVTSTPDVLNNAVAELTIGLMIALARKITQADSFVRRGLWLTSPFPLQRELSGTTVGILGLGRVGKEIARRADAMRMSVVYHGRRAQEDQPYRYYDSLLEMAQAVDWLVLAAPGSVHTEKIVSRRVLEILGPRGMLVNVGRGSLVDEVALIALLESEMLGGAALDVFQSEPAIADELRRLDNVVLSPHIGSATVETRDAMGQSLAESVRRHFVGEALPYRVV